MDPNQPLIPVETVTSSIILIRGHKVLLDHDLAALYGVETKSLNLAVRRNPDRFPPDFMFQLSADEFEKLRTHLGIAQAGRGGRRTPPYAFTEQGVAMLSSVLNSERAVQVNIAIMRAFVQMRELAASNRELARQLDALEKKYDKHDQQFMVVFDAIRNLMTSPEPKKRKIGFKGE